MTNQKFRIVLYHGLAALCLAINTSVSGSEGIASNAPKAAQNLIEPVPLNRPSAEQMIQIDRKYGMFCHFGINTWVGTEWSDGKISPEVYAPPADIEAKVDQWVKFAHEAGMRYFLCITKHHEGFCMWDSKYTDYDVANPAVKVKTDIVKAVADACKKYGIAFCVYYSSWDRHEPTYKEPEKYKEFMKGQLTELLTNYGSVSEVWFDGTWGAKPWAAWQPEIYDHIKRLQPQCQVSLNWTIGLPETPEKMVRPLLQQNGYPIRFFPCDFRIADPELPRDDDPKLFSHAGKSYYMPYESTITVSKKNQWFGFGGDHGSKSVDELEKIFFRATANNNLLVFNIPPGTDGNLIPSQVATVLELGKRLNLGPGKPFPTKRPTLDPSTYGSIISRQAKVKVSTSSKWMPSDDGASLVAENQPNPFAFHTDQEVAPFVELDLGKSMNVTGLFILNAESTSERMATLSASVSLDGKEWTEVWKAEKKESRWEVPVTENVSGTRIPGKMARFIRLQTHPSQPDYLLLKQVEVWGK